jgi:TatD DNase family protein
MNSADPTSAQTRLIDTHCHLDAEAFQQDINDVIQRALNTGVEHMLTIGTCVRSSEAAIMLANRFSCVSAVVGIHPNYVTEAAPNDFERIEDLARHPRVVGIGETGLDKYWDTAPIELQREFFVRHIELSRAIRKPFVVHCRDAEADVLDVLRSQSADGVQLSGVMHAFSGSAETARECVAMGLHISFAGMLTYKKNDALRAVAATVPQDRLLVETDAPYLAPQANRGKRNEPAYVQQTCECLATVHDVAAANMAHRTSENAKRLFRLA